MTPGARIIAAEEILDLIIAAARDNGPAADTIIAGYFRTRRYAGSKDRRAVREHVYRAIRFHGDPPSDGRAAMQNTLEAEAEPAGPAVPRWIIPFLAGPVADDNTEQGALLDRAPLHVRVNALKAGLDTLRAHWPDALPLPGTTHGLALPTGTAVEGSVPWTGGLVEIQDAGSQMIAAACDARPGMTVIDLCAGAGGKTLSLAAAMEGTGRLIAADINRERLSRLPERATRAHAGFVEALLLDAGREQRALDALREAADVVLVDAPCSGTGTWRRNPEARWRLTPERLDRLVKDQARILDFAVPLVRPGGRLVYAVCSLIDREGAGQVDAFLARHSGWLAFPPALSVGRNHGKGHLLTPAHDGTDGFFIAVLVKS